jgi:hypothetical protein
VTEHPRGGTCASFRANPGAHATTKIRGGNVQSYDFDAARGAPSRRRDEGGNVSRGRTTQMDTLIFDEDWQQSP